MRNVPQLNHPAFDEAAERLRGLGHEVSSPAEQDRQEGVGGDTSPLPEDYIQKAIVRGVNTIATWAEAVAVLPDWGGSDGVRVEILTARFCKLPVLDVEGLQPLLFRISVVDMADTPVAPVAKKAVASDPPGDKEVFTTGSVRDTRIGKGRYDLLSPFAVRRLALHYENGADKYDDRNWEMGQPVTRVCESMMRHSFQWLAGENGEDHMAAVAWNAFAIMHIEEMVKRGVLPPELLDRPDYTGSKI